jgi:hypothetical protein
MQRGPGIGPFAAGSYRMLSGCSLLLASLAAVGQTSTATQTSSTTAQTAPGGGGLEEIIVLARRREESLQDAGHRFAEQLHPRPYTVYRAESAGPAQSVRRQSYYGLPNLYLGMRSNAGHREVSLFGKNLANSAQVLSVGNGPQTTSYTNPITRSGATLSSLSATVNVPPKRELGVNVRYIVGSHQVASKSPQSPLLGRAPAARLGIS